MSDCLGSENFSGSDSTRASRNALGNAKPMTVPPAENARETIRPLLNLTRPRASASVLRGSVLANARTSSTVTTGTRIGEGAHLSLNHAGVAELADAAGFCLPWVKGPVGV